MNVGGKEAFSISRVGILDCTDFEAAESQRERETLQIAIVKSAH